MPKNVYGNLYVHRDYLQTLPPDAQALVTDALKLLPKGRTWNLVRVDPVGKDLTFSFYPNFDENPHPELSSWTKIDLKTQSVKSGSYTADNPFILHHKETFIDSSHPLFATFRNLSAQEEKAGLYEPPHTNLIGRKKYWEELLYQKDLVIVDHNLQKGSPPPPLSQIALFTSSQTPIAPTQALQMSGKTAMHRSEPSLPAKILVESKLVKGRLFDWGCGHSTDLKFFIASGLDAAGWDPNHQPKNPPDSYPPGQFPWVFCAYVLNTLPNSNDRTQVLKEIHDFLPAGGHLAIAVRSTDEIESVRHGKGWREYLDGFLTTKTTFQKGFTAPELSVLLTQNGFIKPKTLLEESAVFIIVEKP